MFTVTYEWLKDLTDKEWGHLIQISDSDYFQNSFRSNWDMPVDIKRIRFFTDFVDYDIKLKVTNFLNRISTIEEEAIIIRNLIKFIFCKKYKEPVSPASRVLRPAPITDEDINEQHIKIMKNKCFIINYCCETRDLSKRLSQQRIEYQQELAQKDQTITNIQNAHEEFLNTQLHFYKLAKPQLFQQFEVSNPPALEIGHFLNFLESQWQNKEQQINQVKQHLTNWINLITNKNNHN